jgi:hypothetical protein
MTLLDLSNVTRTMKSLLEQNLARPTMGGLTVNVTPLPPEKVGSAQNTLSLHLYHAAEETYYKNLPGQGNDPPNVAKNPLALSLFYILTAHHESTDPDLDPFTQQNLMGLAIKTFHDFPVITDSTVVNGSSTTVLHPALIGGDNDLQIIMRPISPEDATAFWSTEDQRTTRLSAYYEVRVVMLEPEKPKTMPGIVYALGTFLVNIGSPSIERSRSRVSFPLPPGTGVADPQIIETAPARVSTDATSPNNRLELLGTNLAIGQSRRLVWRNALWAKQGFAAVTLVPGLNPSWSFLFEGERIVVDIAPDLAVDATTTLTVFPGLYAAFLRVVKDEEVVLNQLKQIFDSSNEVGFFVVPRLTGHSAPGPDSRIDVDVAPTFDLTHGAGTDEALDIQLIVEGRVYQRGFIAAPPSPSDNDGHFEVAANTVTLQPLFSVAVADEHPLRLVVNGGESQPFWIVIP